MLIDSPLIKAHAMLMQCNDTEELAKRNWLFSRGSIHADLHFFFATFNQPRYVSLIVLDENSEFLFGQSTTETLTQCQKCLQSKHLKGQLDPPVSNVTFFGPKEVSWTPP